MDEYTYRSIYKYYILSFDFCQHFSFDEYVISSESLGTEVPRILAWNILIYHVVNNHNYLSY